MNVSNIIDMIRADPSILDDVPAFIKRMNEKDQHRVVSSHIEVVDEEVTFSLAEFHGGECTAEDVAEAQRLRDALSMHGTAHHGRRSEQFASTRVNNYFTPLAQYDDDVRAITGH